jgi:hypothetical protein
MVYFPGVVRMVFVEMGTPRIRRVRISDSQRPRIFRLRKFATHTAPQPVWWGEGSGFGLRRPGAGREARFSFRRQRLPRLDLFVDLLGAVVALVVALAVIAAR